MGSVRTFAIIGSIFLAGAAFYLLEDILVPFLAAWVLAYLLVPMVDLLNRRIPRALAILAVFAMLIAALSGIAFGLVPALKGQINTFLGQLPAFIAHIDQMSSGLFEHLHLKVHARELTHQVENALFTLGSRLVGAPGEAVHTMTQLVKVSVFVALVPVLMFYLLRDWHDLALGIESFMRASSRRRVQGFLLVSDQVLRHFLHGELLVMLAIGAMYATGYLIVGVSLGLVLGILAGIVSVIPFASFALAGIPAIVISAAQFHDFTHPLMILGVIAVTELVANTVLVPLLVGRFVRVHPAAVLLFIFAGGTLFGILGMVIALPLAATVSAYWKVQFRTELARSEEEVH